MESLQNRLGSGSKARKSPSPGHDLRYTLLADYLAFPHPYTFLLGWPRVCPCFLFVPTNRVGCGSLDWLPMEPPTSSSPSAPATPTSAGPPGPVDTEPDGVGPPPEGLQESPPESAAPAQADTRERKKSKRKGKKKKKKKDKKKLKHPRFIVRRWNAVALWTYRMFGGAVPVTV